LIYMILRPPEKLTESYERALEEEALLQDIEERAQCPGCKRRIETDWVVCPTCYTQLKKRCVSCNRILRLKWKVCPYCEAPQEPAEEPHEELQPALTVAEAEPEPVESAWAGQEAPAPGA